MRLSRNFHSLLGGRHRLLIIFLLCTNVVTLFNLYGNVPQYLARLYMGPRPGPSEAASSGQMSYASERSFERGHGLQGFVFFSAYRLSSSNFIAIGLTALALRHAIRAEDCRWRRPDQVVVPGTLTVDYPGDAHGRAYEVALLFCTLGQDIPSEWGGELLVTIDMEEIAVYTEKPGRKRPIKPQAPYRSNLTFCSSPMFGAFDPSRVDEFLQYHRRIHGVDHFHMYDVGGIDEELMAQLRPYVLAGAMTITDVTEVNDFETWYAQVLVINDCAYRSHLTARWLLFLDFDEFLFVPVAPHSIHGLLQQHQTVPWLSFGSEYWHTKECTHSTNASSGQPAPWALERLVFRQAEVHCVNPARYPTRNLCAGYDGHRKYLVDPRQVQLCGIHHVVKAHPGGVHVDTDVAHLKHYRAWNLRSLRVCRQFIHDSDWIPASWARDFSMAHVAKLARLNPARV